MKKILPLILLVLIQTAAISQIRMRDYGIETGIFKPGKNNAITDVPGVKVGHKTLIQGEDMRTGVTAIIPHEGNLFQQKTPAAIYVGRASFS